MKPAQKHTSTKHLRRNKKGFSLIEVVIAIAVITLVITAAAEVTQTSIKMGSITTNELVAHHLAEEGLEIVRNTRDSNWLRNDAWDNNLAAGVYVIEENPTENSAVESTGPSWKLVKKEEAVPTSARYEREITISYAPISAAGALAVPGAINPSPTAATSTGSDEAAENKVMTVVSKVTYSERRGPKSLSITTQLTDWKQGPL